MGRVDHGRRLFITDAREDAWQHLDDSDFHAKLGSGSRHFKPDQAAADDHEMLRGPQFGGEHVGMRFGAQVMHARRTERQ